MKRPSGGPSSAEVSTWYRKAAESGFKDIESYQRERHTGSSLEPIRLPDDEAAEYWQLAEAFAETHQFRDEQERALWAEHLERRGVWARALAQAAYGKTSGHAQRRAAKALAELQDVMMGRKRRRGRPVEPGSSRQAGHFVGVRLGEDATAALYFLKDRLGLTLRQTIELALLSSAKTL